MLIEIDGIGIALIRKCGSSAIRRAINKSGRGVYRDVTAEEFATLAFRLVMIREPHERIESTFRMYRATGGIGTGYCHALTSFAAFVLRACHDPQGDPHLAPRPRR
jgi:hypothetical protein